MPQQKTLSKPVRLGGVGLHTGAEVRLELVPADPDTGVVFVRTDLAGCPRVEARISNLGFRPRRTALVKGSAEVHTTEHLLAALCASGVQNVEVRLDAPELPGLDGSALPFYGAIQEGGIVPQGVPARQIDVVAPVHAEERGAWIAAFPSDNGSFTICYTLDYSALAQSTGASPAMQALATQYLEVTVTEEVFAREIAPARTFVFEEEVHQLRAEGLGRGATPQNTVVLGRDGILENRLRFRDELVRHKVLDLIGDLYLLGSAPRGRFVAAKSGHALNVRIAKMLEPSEL